MWHEARRQERKIRGMLVDYRRRAERRRDFYEKIKADPTQFLQLHGRPCKIHLDPSIAAAADSPATMMPWQGQADNLIDRFDVRAHLDFIPPIRGTDEDDISYEERQCNYERYRILAQNIFLGISEDKFLKQLHLEEQFGYTADGDKEKKRKTGAAIGFNYDDPTNSAGKEIVKTDHSSSDDETDSDLDVDLCIDVSKVEQSQAHEMNKCGQQYGMCSNDFYSFLTNDMEEAENIRLAREEEHEKALFSGRKSRRERRAHREKRLANRVLSPPSYAARESPTYSAFRESKSRSKSPSPVNTGQITYITSFGDDEEPAPSTSSKPSYADKVKYGKRKLFSVDEKFTNSRKYRRRSRSKSRSRSRSRSLYRYNRRRTPTRSRSRNRRKSRSQNRSRNRSYSRSPKRRSRSCSRSRRIRKRTRSRSISSSHSSSSSRSSRSKSQSSRSSSSRSKSPKLRSKLTRSRSKSPKSRSKLIKSSSKSPRSRSKSRSLSIKKEEPPKPIQRYYGRRVSDKSSSELEDSPDEEPKLPANNPAPTENLSKFGNSGSALKSSTAPSKLTPQERLKRKMQLLLNKQYKADKIAEQIRSERAQQEQRNREDELREMALKLRRKQRERRHAYDDNNSNDSSDSDSASSLERNIESRSKRSSSPVSPKRKISREEEKKTRDDDNMKSRDDERKTRDDERKTRDDERKISNDERKIREDERKSRDDKKNRDDEKLKFRDDEKEKLRNKDREERNKRDEERTKKIEVKDRFRNREDERRRDEDRRRDRDKSPYRSRNEYRYYRDRNTPSPNRDYDDTKRKNRSLVDY